MICLHQSSHPIHERQGWAGGCGSGMGWETEFTAAAGKQPPLLFGVFVPHCCDTNGHKCGLNAAQMCVAALEVQVLGPTK